MLGSRCIRMADGSDTHNRLVDDSYITIAHGRDYRDCMLDIGIFSGYNVQQSQWVNASVHEQVA